jgi:hypothetical protein
MVMAPHWLDAVIDQVVQDGGDDYAIAEAIAKSERMISAIADARANFQPAQPGKIGAAPLNQVIRAAVCTAVASTR